MINPNTMSLAAITVMLWIMWTDTIRNRRPAPILYALRIALFLIVSGIFILNMVRHPEMFPGGARAIAIVAVVVGLAGAGYFTRRLVKKR